MAPVLKTVELSTCVSDYAADLAAFMDGLNLETAVIAGHSMGSAVALRFAIDRPERAAGLVLIGAPSTLAGSPDARRFWDSTVSADLLTFIKTLRN